MHNSVKSNTEFIIQQTGGEMIVLAPLEYRSRNAGAGEALFDPFSLGC
jgi:hypothetical protein